MCFYPSGSQVKLTHSYSFHWTAFGGPDTSAGYQLVFQLQEIREIFEA
jgi:hypothetical protein